MSTTPTYPAAAGVTMTAMPTAAINTNTTSTRPTEEELRKQLRMRLQRITRREPLDPTYKQMLLSSSAKPPVLPKDKTYRKMGTNLREHVESYRSSSEGTWGKNREDLEDGAMRAAFTLREGKKFEQDGYIAASIAAMNGRRLSHFPAVSPPNSSETEGMRKRRMEAMALGLQERERKKKQKALERSTLLAAQQKVLAADKALLEKEKTAFNLEKDDASLMDDKVRAAKEKERLEARDREIEEKERIRSIEKAKEREKERERVTKRAEEEEKDRIQKEKDEALRRARMAETPQQALHRLYEPVFKLLWDMEFSNLHNTNPFRIVIDKENCALMGVPDYCDIIDKPMNLTYIQEKVEKKSYETLQDFFADVELLIDNALLYNSDPTNEFHIAAREMKRKYKKYKKKVGQSLQM